MGSLILKTESPINLDSEVAEIVKNAFALNPDVVSVFGQRDRTLGLLGINEPLPDEDPDAVELAILEIKRQVSAGRRAVEDSGQWTL